MRKLHQHLREAFISYNQLNPAETNSLTTDKTSLEINLGRLAIDFGFTVDPKAPEKFVMATLLNSQMHCKGIFSVMGTLHEIQLMASDLAELDLEPIYMQRVAFQAQQLQRLLRKIPSLGYKSTGVEGHLNRTRVELHLTMVVLRSLGLMQLNELADTESILLNSCYTHLDKLRRTVVFDCLNTTEDRQTLVNNVMNNCKLVDVFLAA